MGRASRDEGIPENSACSGNVDDVVGSEMGEGLMNYFKSAVSVVGKQYEKHCSYLEKDAERHG